MEGYELTREGEVRLREYTTKEFESFGHGAKTGTNMDGEILWALEGFGNTLRGVMGFVRFNMKYPVREELIRAGLKALISKGLVRESSSEEITESWPGGQHESSRSSYYYEGVH